jgi:tRNA (cytidine/uridine-2'-O-)-methyltransferase
MHIVLVHPEIAGNTGNIIRLCANTGSHLHLVEPLGFVLDDARMRRSGLDYHEFVNMRVHPTWAACAQELAAQRMFAFSSRATTRYNSIAFRANDVLVFGCERAGLPEDVLDEFPLPQQLTVPMRPGNRSLNLANTVALAVYEAWRQLDFVGADTTLTPLAGAGLSSEDLGAVPFDS